jgi:nickel transport protein
MKKILILVSFILALTPAGPALAHKVILFAWVEDGIIHTESSFAGQRKARDCPLLVRDDTGRVVHEGKTDDQGLYSFKIPDDVETDLILTLEAGAGHQAEWRIKKEELVQAPAKADIEKTLREKEKLESGPSVWKIISGIVLIFLLAGAGKWFSRKKKARHD